MTPARRVLLLVNTLAAAVLLLGIVPGRVAALDGRAAGAAAAIAGLLVLLVYDSLFDSETAVTAHLLALAALIGSIATGRPLLLLSLLLAAGFSIGWQFWQGGAWQPPHSLISDN